MTQHVDREAALRLWRDIANGALANGDYGPFDLHAWVRDVARALLEADQGPPRERQRLIAEAVRLVGHINGHSALDAFLNREVLPLEDFDVIGDGTASERGSVAWVVEQARQRRLLAPTYDVDEKKARELIRRRMADLRTKQV